MFDIDEFIDACESLKINEWDYSIGIGNEGIGNIVKNIIDFVIKSIGKLSTVIRGMFGMYKGYYYDAIHYFIQGYDPIFDSITDLLYKITDEIIDNAHNNEDISLTMFESFMIMIDDIINSIDPINSDVFLSVDDSVKKDIQPQVKDIEFKGKIKKYSSMCDKSAQYMEKYKDKMYIIDRTDNTVKIGDNTSKLLSHFVECTRIVQNGMMEALNKCTWEGRNNKQKAFSTVNFL